MLTKSSSRYGIAMHLKRKSRLKRNTKAIWFCLWIWCKAYAMDIWLQTNLKVDGLEPFPR